MKQDTSDQQQAASTRQALIEAGLRLFGSKGFSATSTREIAGEAGANVASIAYHFGSKDGLRRAVAEMIAKTMRGVLDAALNQERLVSAFEGLGEEGARREAAVAVFEEAVGRMAVFALTNPVAAHFPRFILREMAEPSAAFDILYGGVLEPVHKKLCAAFASATGTDPESEETRLAVFALIGPLVYFRIGAPAVQRRLGWDGYGEAEARKIAHAIARIVTARIDQDASR